MQKRGKTAAGTQRWLCLTCRHSHSLGHDTQKRGRLLDRFVAWLLGKASQDELEQSGRTFRDQTAWCWNIVPPLVLTGEVHHAVVVDGLWVGDQVCLIARTTSYVIAWVWVPYESSAYWLELFKLLPPPRYVVCDGQKGLLKALAICWPKTIVQRCRFHVWLNVKQKLTLNPQAKASRKLLKLTRQLLQVQTRSQARSWKHDLKRWYSQHQAFINQRTIKTGRSPRQRRWRYTHERTRSAYRQLRKQTDDLLRCSYRPDPELPGTINHIEGGINSQIRTKLKAHRGMPAEHQVRLTEWYLYTRTETPKPPRKCL